MSLYDACRADNHKLVEEYLNRHGKRRCNVCQEPVAFGEFSLHMFQQHNLKQYQNRADCTECPFWHEDHAEVTKHIQEKHSTRCPWCDFSALQKDFASQHDQKSCLGQQSTCPFCGATLKITRVPEHVLKCPEKWQCRGCREFFAAKNSQLHLDKCKQITRCIYCAKYYENSDCLVHMAREIHPADLIWFASILGHVTVPKDVLNIIGKYSAFDRAKICVELAPCIGCGHYKSKEEQLQCSHVFQCPDCTLVGPLVQKSSHQLTCPEGTVTTDCKCQAIIKRKDLAHHNCIAYQVDLALAVDRDLIGKLHGQIQVMANHIQALEKHIVRRNQDIRDNNSVHWSFLNDEFENNDYILNEDAFI